ncbi:MAG: ATP-binding protein [Chloroflexia bacterium]|nr:ATP-binding protein [Chloroflexia bacterium]
MPKCLTDFGAYFELARNSLKNYPLKILDVEYQFKDNQNIITLSDNQMALQLHQVSSGMQAVIPMLLVLEHFRSKLTLIRRSYVIEEPELNLFQERRIN